MTTVLPNRNLTLDIHLVDDFVHLFDKNLTSETDINLLILNIAFPAGVSLAFEPLVSLLDTYYVGQYLGESSEDSSVMYLSLKIDGDTNTHSWLVYSLSGATSLSAYGLSERVFVFGFYIINFLSTSITPIGK